MRVSRLRGRGDTPRSRMVQGGLVLLGLTLGTSAWAGQVSAPFAVRVSLSDAASCAATPEAPARPSTVVIECRAKPIGPHPVPMPRSDGQAFRFLIPSGNGQTRYGAVDLYAGAGTITSWRIVHLTGWDYLEMTVGW